MLQFPSRYSADGIREISILEAKKRGYLPLRIDDILKSTARARLAQYQTRHQTATLARPELKPPAVRPQDPIDDRRERPVRPFAP